jgi:hypothetical protein
MEKPRHIMKINPAKVVIPLLGVSLVMIIFSLGGQREYHVSNPTAKFFLDMFTKEFFVNSGTNIATYWNMLILIIVAALALVIAMVKQSRKDKHGYEWWLLGAVFFYFATDALAGITQKFSTLLKDLPNMQVGTYYNWFYPVAAVLIILIVVFFIRFYFHLDAPNRALFPISITLYVLGAFREELFSGYYAELYGNKSVTYMLMTHAEQLLEHVGVILMIYMLLTYIVAHYSEIEFTALEPEKTA